MTTMLPPLCMTCSYFVMEKGNWYCSAFPKGIPDDILHGAADHHKPYPGDQGIRYFPKNENPRIPDRHL